MSIALRGALIPTQSNGYLQNVQENKCWENVEKRKYSALLLTGTEIVTAVMESTPENPNEIRNRMEEVSSLECSFTLKKPE